MWTAKTSDQTLGNAQADLSLRWAHMPLFWFCYEAAQIYNYYDDSLSLSPSGTSRYQELIYFNSNIWLFIIFNLQILHDLPHDKINKNDCEPSED